MLAKQKENTIFTVMKRVNDDRVKAPPLLEKGVKLKKTKEGKSYFFIPLEENPQPEKLKDRICEIKAHHLSVYQHYNDQVAVVSAYHYTANIVIDRRQLILHAYFDNSGAFLEALVKDDDGCVLTNLQDWQSTFQKMSTRFTIKILAEVFELMETLAQDYDRQLVKISIEIDKLSKTLYGHHTQDPDPASTAENYLAAIKSYVACQTEYNEISLEPELTKIRFLQQSLDNFVPPKKKPKVEVEQEVVVLIEESAVKEGTQTNNTATQKSRPQPKAVLREEAEEVIPEVPPHIQKLLDRHDDLDKKSSAENIAEQFSILKTCEGQLDKVPENVAMDILILQNKILKKANFALTLFVKAGDSESVRIVLPAIRSVNQEMIAKAAMDGKVEILFHLIRKYKGPKYFYMKNEGRLWTNILYEENLPTASLQILLDHGCDPNTIDPFGRSLLYIAITRNDLARVKMIVAANADVNQRSTQSSHRFAIMPEINPGIDSLKPRLKKKLERAVEKEKKRQIANAKENLSNTPLISSTSIMCAIQKRNIAIVRMLKDRGCDFLECDDHGSNAFSVALLRVPSNPATRLNEEILHFLIDECGLNIDMMIAVRRNKITGLFCAVQYRAMVPEIAEDIEVLLSCNADPNIVCECATADGKKLVQFTPFGFAIQSHYFDLVALMVEKSKIRISQDELEFACLAIELLAPEQLTEFRLKCSEHVRRFAPLPLIAGDPNSFFHASPPSLPALPAESYSGPQLGHSSDDDTD